MIRQIIIINLHSLYLKLFIDIQLVLYIYEYFITNIYMKYKYMLCKTCPRNIKVNNFIATDLF